MGSVKSKVISGTLSLSISNYILFIMNFFIQLYLARVLAPEIFGQISFILSIVSIFSAFGQWGIGAAIAIRDNDEFINSIFTMKLIYSAVMIIISLFIYPSIIKTYDLELGNIFIFFCIATAIKNISDIFRIIIQNDMQFSLIGLTRIKIKIISIIVCLILLILNQGIWALTVIYTFESLLEISFMFECKKKLKIQLNLNEIKLFLLYIKDVILIDILGTLENKYDDFIVGAMCSSNILGIYTMGWKITRLFNTTTLTTFNSVIVPTISKVRGEHKKLEYSYNFTLRNIVKILLLVYGTVFITSEKLIYLLLGEEWISAVDIIRFGIIYSCLVPIYAINKEFMYSIGKADIQRNIQIVLFISIVLFVPIGVFLNKGIGAVLGLTLAYIIGTLLSFILFSKIVYINIIQVFIKPLLSVSLSMIICIYFNSNSNIENIIVNLFLDISKFVAVYFSSLIFLDFKMIKNDLLTIINSVRKNKTKLCFIK